MPDLTGAQITELWDRLDSDRSTLKSLVQQVMDYYLPHKGTVTVRRIEGEDLQREITDSTGERCLQRFGAGMRSYVCPPGRAWRLLALRPGAEEMGSDLARPLASLNDIVRQATAESNFDEAANEVFQDLGTAGTATIEPRQGTVSALEYQAHPFEQITFQENARGRVNRVFRKFSYTADQAVEEFGEANLPKEIREAYHSESAGERTKRFEFVHAVTPRGTFDAGRRDVKNMTFAAQTVAVRDKAIVRTSGMPQQRYLVCRFAKGTGETHGRSPSMTALPDVKMLNRAEEDIIDGIENVVRPMILTPMASGLQARRVGNARMLYYKPNLMNASVKPEPFNGNAQPQIGEQWAELRRAIVAQALYNDLFQAMDESQGETATGVRARLAEKLNLLAPNYGRLKAEWFDPQTEIDLSILGGLRFGAGAAGVLSFASVRYVSTLALAIEYAALGALRDGWQFLSWIAEVDPTVWDRLSFDDIVDELTQNLGWPARWLRPMSETKAIREWRMQFQQQQQAQQLALAAQTQALGMTKKPEAGSPAEAALGEAA